MLRLCEGGRESSEPFPTFPHAGPAFSISISFQGRREETVVLCQSDALGIKRPRGNCRRFRQRNACVCVYHTETGVSPFHKCVF